MQDSIMGKTNLGYASVIFNSRAIVLVLLGLVHLTPLLGQDRFELFFTAKARSRRIPEKTVNIAQSDSKIVIDGILDEKAWNEADMATGFQQNFPADDSVAASETEVRFTYNHHSIYVGITCYDELPGKYVVESLKRDFEDRDNDYFMLILDPYDDLTNGFVFAVSPL
jgi:hypothetical protein